MMQVRKERGDALVRKEELMISLVPPPHELKGTRECPRSTVDGLTGNVKRRFAGS
jgi:hypothetical protein